MKARCLFRPEALGAWLLAAGLVLTGCAGGGGGGTPEPPPARSSGGFWHGTLTSTNGAEGKAALAILSPADEIRIISAAGFQYVVAPGLGPGTAYAPSGKTFGDGSAVAKMNMKSRSFKTSSSTGGGASATFTFNCMAGGDTVGFVSSHSDLAYGTPLALAALSGTYTSAPADNSLGQALTLVVAGVTGTVAVPGGDAFTVALVVPDAGRSAIDLTLTYTPAGGAAESPVPGTGSFRTAPGATAPTLTFGAAGGSRAFCGRFTKL